MLVVIGVSGYRVSVHRGSMRVRHERGGHHLLDWNHNLLHHRSGMYSVSGFLHYSVESVVVVSSVVYSTCSTVRFNQLVITFNLVTNAFLSLFLDVVSVSIMDSVFKLILRRSLEMK